MKNDLEQRVNAVLKTAEDSKGQFSGEMNHNWSDYELDTIINLLQAQQAEINRMKDRIAELEGGG
ncbi:phage shock protein B [Caudoviricetes sp.]|nr:phage shock protein B [Caudoviricetes sp.]